MHEGCGRPKEEVSLSGVLRFRKTPYAAKTKQQDRHSNCRHRWQRGLFSSVSHVEAPFWERSVDFAPHQFGKSRRGLSQRE